MDLRLSTEAYFVYALERQLPYQPEDLVCVWAQDARKVVGEVHFFAVLVCGPRLKLTRVLCHSVEGLVALSIEISIYGLARAKAAIPPGLDCARPYGLHAGTRVMGHYRKKS